MTPRRPGNGPLRWRSPACAGSSRSRRRSPFPSTTDEREPFPDRDRILFLTFAVILVTLVGQGLMLPAVIRALGLANAGRRERHADRIEEFAARRQAIEAAIARLDELVAERRLAEDIVHPLRTRHHERLKHVEHRSDGDEGHKRSSICTTRLNAC